MFPIFKSIGEGVVAALGFVRAYPRQSAGFLALYGASAAVAASGKIKLPLPVWLAGQLTTWSIGAVTLLLLAPVWAAVFRFAILGDTDRRWWQPDMRARRVAGVMLVISFVSLLGAVPFALGLDVLPRIGPRRLVAGAAIGFAVLVKIAGWWLNARLAIAPAMAATGTKPQALDTSFAYTKRAALRVLATRLLVYLPLLVVMGGVMLMSQNITPAAPGQMSALAIAIIMVSTILTAATELVDGAVMARVALQLVKAQRARATEAARRAREAVDDDSDD